METTAHEHSTVLANISRWKSGLASLPALALGIIPNLPGFGEGLTRTAFFYTVPVGVAVRWTACGVLILLGLLLLSSVVLTLVSSAKAVWVEDGYLAWGQIGTKRVRLEEVGEVSFDTSLNRVRLDRREGGKPEYIPTLGMLSSDAPGPLIEKLRQLIKAT